MEGTPTVPRTARPKKPKQEKGEKAELKKRNLEEMRSAEDDTDVEFGSKIKREIPEGAFEGLIGGANGATLGVLLAAGSHSSGGPASSTYSLPVQPSIESNGTVIKLEPDDTDKLEVKTEPAKKDKVEFKTEPKIE